MGIREREKETAEKWLRVSQALETRPQILSSLSLGGFLARGASPRSLLVGITRRGRGPARDHWPDYSPVAGTGGGQVITTPLRSC